MRVEVLDRDSKRARQGYLGVPFKLAADDPLWFPGPREPVAFALSRRHPFHEHSEAEFFTVGDGRTCTGRLAVMDNSSYNRHQGGKDAFFTHFECADDAEAAAALFDAAAAWAAQRGLQRLVGPVGFLPTDARGMMVAGHGALCSLSLPYSPPYYSALMKRLGFAKLADYVSGEISDGDRIPERIELLERRVAERSGIVLRMELRRSRLKRVGARLMEVYESGGRELPFYYPLSPAEKRCIIGHLARSACPELIHWLEQRDGTICGLLMALPNYLEALRRAEGRRVASRVNCVRQRSRPKEITASMIYLVPGKQGRGLNLLLFAAFQEAALRLGCRRGVVGPVHEQNRPSLAVLEKTGIVFHMRHRLYERRIE